VLTLGFLETECGHNINDKACDFRLLDKNDNPWKLSDHLGDVVLLDLSAMWCAPCQSAAATAQATQDDYASKGFHYVTILVVDTQNNTMDASEATQWADTFGITSAPVLQGSRDLLVSGGAAHGYPLTSWPTFVFLDRTHTVAYGIYGFNEAWIRQVVEGLL
jgi:thiol-disulfide isomerase/thioredoxin